MGMALRGPASPPRNATARTSPSPANSGCRSPSTSGWPAPRTRSPRCERDGLLGPDVNYIHANQLTDEEMDLIAATGGTVTITPSTDMLMQFGTYPATGPSPGARHRLRPRGRHDLQRGDRPVLRDAPRAGRGTVPRERRIPRPQQAGARGRAAPTGHAATGHARRRPGLDLADHTGSLTPGKQADITVIDMRSPHLDGFGDPVAMLLGAGPADVETVMVGGEFVKREGKLTGDHATQALELIHATRRHLRASAAPQERNHHGPGAHHRIRRWPRPHGRGHPGRPGTRGHPARPQRPPCRRRRPGTAIGPGSHHRRPDHDRRDAQRRRSRQRHRTLNAVIHNAGIGYREPRRIETEDGLEHLFAVNVLAPYLLTALINPPARLVYLSSGMHRGGDASLADPQFGPAALERSTGLL